MRISDWSSDVCSSDLRGTLAHQGFEGEHHILGLYRLAVMEACLRAQVEAHPAVVRSLFYLFCQKAVDGEGLVQAVGEIGRASCRERVCTYELIAVVAVSLTTANRNINN